MNLTTLDYDGPGDLAVEPVPGAGHDLMAIVRRHIARIALRDATEAAPVAPPKPSRLAEVLGLSDEFVRKVRREMVAVGRLGQAEVVKGRDGAVSPATIESKSDNAASSQTVGEDSNGSRIDSHEPEVGVMLTPAVFVGWPHSASGTRRG